jgi:Periplasmic component of the Tol biopolymer transport system
MYPFRCAIVGLAVVTLPASAQMANVGGTRPSVSPDGQWVAYNAGRNGAWDVYVARADGSDERRVTSLAEHDFVNLGPPTWIGSRVFVWHRVGDTTRAFIADVLRAEGVAQSGDALGHIKVPADATQIRPSPDGTRLLYLHGGRQSRLAISNVDGTGERDVTRRNIRALNPDWSRDGKHIAFTVVDSASHGQIATVDPDGRQFRVITHFDNANGLPQWVSWAPDGKHVVFQAGKYSATKAEESTAHLWLVDIETGEATKLGGHSAMLLDETPTWFPDGGRIAFQSNRTGAFQVWTMNASGREPHQLTNVDASGSDYQRSRGSEAGLFRVSLRPEGDSVAIRKLQTWTLHIATSDSVPVDGATIEIDGGMPEHGHGLPTQPVVTKELGHGDYLVDGVKFNMTGWWVLKLRIRAAAGTDLVLYNLKL